LKVAILAGGRGTRMGGGDAPKALAEIGERPILWHVMRIYAHAGFSDFVIALGHRGERIRAWVEEIQRDERDPASGWRIQAVDTGDDTATGGRVKRLAPHLGGGAFHLTWCDGIADVDPAALARFHAVHGRLATVTAVRPPSRFGHLELAGDRVTRFREKPRHREWINGAFFVLESAVLDRVEGDDTPFEGAPLEGLVRDGELMAFRHEGFWRCMDTLRERRELDTLWRRGEAPWKRWR
jgi:glucose-1-phosphate cytidylyltransferase